MLLSQQSWAALHGLPIANSLAAGFPLKQQVYPQLVSTMQAMSSPCTRHAGVGSLFQRPTLSLRYRMKHCTRAAAAIELPNKYSKARQRLRSITVHASTCEASAQVYMLTVQVSPKGDLVLCKVAEAEEQTTGGLLLPTSAQTKPTSGWPCLN